MKTKNLKNLRNIVISLLVGIAATNAYADSVAILACRTNNSGSTGVDLVNCSISSINKDVPIDCPIIVPSLTPCSQTLADFLSLPGFKIIDTQRMADDGIIYTITNFKDYDHQ